MKFKNRLITGVTVLSLFVTVPSQAFFVAPLAALALLFEGGSFLGYLGRTAKIKKTYLESVGVVGESCNINLEDQDAMERVHLCAETHLKSIHDGFSKTVADAQVAAVKGDRKYENDRLEYWVKYYLAKNKPEKAKTFEDKKVDVDAPVTDKELKTVLSRARYGIRNQEIKDFERGGMFSLPVAKKVNQIMNDKYPIENQDIKEARETLNKLYIGDEFDSSAEKGVQWIFSYLGATLRLSQNETASSVVLMMKHNADLKKKPARASK